MMKQLGKSHTRPCISRNKTRTIATETQDNLQSIEALIQIVTLLTPTPRPVVGPPTYNVFLETMAMGLKHYKDTICLHVVDHCTRLSTLAVILNKQPGTIIKYIFKSWISTFILPTKFLTHSVGEAHLQACVRA